MPATDPNELEYTYEQNLKVLPSFGVIPVFGTLMGIIGVPGHAVQPDDAAARRAGPRDPQADPDAAPTRSTRAQVTGIFDRQGRERRRRGEDDRRVGDAALHEPLLGVHPRRGRLRRRARARVRATFRPTGSPTTSSSRRRCRSRRCSTGCRGDKNPLHADPGFAAMGGFDTPILHGLCSFGIVCKAVVDNALGGDVTKVARYQVRFSGVVFPGETIVTSMWREGDKILVRARSQGARSSPSSPTPRSRRARGGSRWDARCSLSVSA